MSLPRVSQEEVDHIVRDLLERAGRLPRRKEGRGATQPTPAGGFAARLREARRGKNLKQSRMARRLGFTESYYQSIESGRRPATLAFRAAAYAWALGEGLQHLFDPGREGSVVADAPLAEPTPTDAATQDEEGASVGVPASLAHANHLLVHSARSLQRCAAPHSKSGEQSASFADPLRRSEGALSHAQLLCSSRR